MQNETTDRAALRTDPAAAYAAQRAEVLDKLRRLTGAVEAHAQEAAPTWGRVGDLGYVDSELAELLAFIG